MQQHLSLLQDVRGCMMRFEALTPEIVAGQSEDGLTYDEMKAVLAEAALSWTTDPVCALWFANRSARGTRLISARVTPEQILAYNAGHQGEHEVIMPFIRPSPAGRAFLYFEADIKKQSER